MRYPRMVGKLRGLPLLLISSRVKVTAYPSAAMTLIPVVSGLRPTSSSNR